MKTLNFFSHTKPIIDLIVEDTGLHPDIVRTVLQSQTDILLEEVCIKGHIVNLCGLGSVGIYDCEKFHGRGARYRTKFRRSAQLMHFLWKVNKTQPPEGVEYPLLKSPTMTEEQKRQARSRQQPSTD